MFTLDVPSPDEIHAQAARAIANGIGLTARGCFLRTTGGKVSYPVGPGGCGCPLARVGEWCQHRSLFAIAFGQVPPQRIPREPIPFRPRREHADRYPRPLRQPRPPIPFRPRRPAA
jgi:hypothetical protein